jgi:hypothetical protein
VEETPRINLPLVKSFFEEKKIEKDGTVQWLQGKWVNIKVVLTTWYIYYGCTGYPAG